MNDHDKYLGIDLGTTNSAVAIFTDGKVNSLLNARGEVNTPSVVRITNKGVVVGAKAQRHLYTDIKNTFKEFKRLLGTQEQSKADFKGNCWSAEELASEVLKSLKNLAQEQANCCFDKVVITVPALFELPQSKATANAARLAGFEKVELLPEPVASGLAMGWSKDQTGKAWLVFDLGGGTFDVSLLETRDGLLRVVAHDGDNFLGGRDIDRAIVNWIFEVLVKEYNLTLKPNDDNYASIKRHFEAAAETAKIRLSSTPISVIELEFEYDDEDYEFDIEITQEQLRQLIEPLIQKTIDICRRLIKSEGLSIENLEHVVLVGGPAHMPIIKEFVENQLASVTETNLDPMSLVSQGAAIYAATINLGCSESTSKHSKTQSYQVWLQYPSVCTELNPTIMGRIIDDQVQPHSIKLINIQKTWESPFIEIDESGIFIVEAQVKSSSNNSFELVAYDNNQKIMPLSHQIIQIVQGLTLSDPPLSRSIGLALADGSVRVFIERGTALPAKRTFMQSTIDTLLPDSHQTLEIPIVQGERRQSRFCRKVGCLVIDSAHLKKTLHVGTAIEISIEVDKGGDLKAYALLPDEGKVIEGVAHLVMGFSTPEDLNVSSQNINMRLSVCLQNAFRERDEVTIEALNPMASQIHSIIKEVISINNEFENDVDACQRLSRQLMEIEAEIELVETKDQLAELIEECESRYFAASSMVTEYGDETDQRILNNCGKKLEHTLDNIRQGELERLIERLDQLYRSAHEKSPEYWKDIFLEWASLSHVAINPRKANAIVEKGHSAIENEQYDKLKSLTNELYALIPQHYKTQASLGSYDSGVY